MGFCSTPTTWTHLEMGIRIFPGLTAGKPPPPLPGKSPPIMALAMDNAHGPQDDIGPAAIVQHGIFPSGSGVRSGPEHGGGGHYIGAYRPNFQVFFLESSELFHQAAANTAALSIDYQYFHGFSPFKHYNLLPLLRDFHLYNSYFEYYRLHFMYTY